jgi:hypothetical protein
MGDRLGWCMELSNASVYSAHELGDRSSEISSSDRANFPAGLLGQFFARTIAAITDFLKLDYFSSNPCDHPI